MCIRDREREDGAEAKVHVAAVAEAASRQSAGSDVQKSRAQMKRRKVEELKKKARRKGGGGKQRVPRPAKKQEKLGGARSRGKKRRKAEPARMESL
eukprot:NODE_27267_length_519_cov_3.168367.p4 GENE.NODE_27267_length_519_cov_3.168367~~NODE_27267_length_519_cov_3.168367.p4  ORF type:complete len:96 (-),score=23.92 NODE_27267_length_519_cov_3.168367:86-373(-)